MLERKTLLLKRSKKAKVVFGQEEALPAAAGEGD